MAVAGVSVDIGGKTFRNAKMDIAIAGADGPSRLHRGTCSRHGVDVSVARAKREQVKRSVHIDVAVAGIKLERARNPADVRIAIAGAKLMRAFDPVDAKIPVASVDIQIAAGRP